MISRMQLPNRNESPARRTLPINQQATIILHTVLLRKVRMRIFFLRLDQLDLAYSRHLDHPPR